MFVIEKYGYLTNKEKNQLQEDLKKEGFELERINIIAPTRQHTYGEILEFIIEYKQETNHISMQDSILNQNHDEIVIRVYKNCYSKI